MILLRFKTSFVIYVFKNISAYHSLIKKMLGMTLIHPYIIINYYCTWVKNHYKSVSLVGEVLDP